MEDLTVLIERARTGDAEAFGQIVGRFQGMAYAYAFALLGDFHLAQDAAQEAFVEAYLCLPALREPVAFPAWFRRIVFKRCDRLTRGKHLATLPLDLAEQAASRLPEPAEVAERHELRESVRAAIDSLPTSQKIVTALFYLGGYSQQEIAGFIEVPARTVKSRLHAARLRLRERMLDMVEDEFKSRVLPEGFTQQTVERAVARAAELNQARRFEEAEQVLAGALASAPEHPGALRELNRTLMWGRVYGQGRWDLLPKLTRQGQIVLNAASDDEGVSRDLARTLLAMPAMPEAIAFLEGWITRSGPDVERLGMLAWARGCVADYEAAEARWQEMLQAAAQAGQDRLVEAASAVRFAAYTLVDCFAAAGELAQARRVAQQAWTFCRGLKERDKANPQGELAWMTMFHQAGLDLDEVAGALRERYSARPGAEAQASLLCLRAYTGEAEPAIAGWLAWAGERLARQELPLLEAFRGPITGAFRRQGKWTAQIRLAQATWELVRDVAAPEAAPARAAWNEERFNCFGCLDQGDWAAAERLSRQAAQEMGLQAGAAGLILVAAARGGPTPAEIVRAIETDGIASVDPYGLFGWYAVAREAAAAGDAPQAFEALRQAVSFWSNPPLYYLGYMENDRRWGDLAQTPEFKAIFAEKRQRVGPVYGQLHYFPGW